MTTEIIPLNEPAPQVPAVESTPEVPAWTPPKDQDEFNRIIGDRLARERQKYADHDDLKAKAALWDEIEAESASEFDKTQQALTEAQSRYEAAQTRIVTAELKAAGVPADLIEDLDLSRFIDGDGEIAEDRIEALRTKYAALTTASPRMAPNPAQGTSAQPPLSLNERIAAAQSAGDMRTVMRLKAAQAVTSSTN